MSNMSFRILMAVGVMFLCARIHGYIPQHTNARIHRTFTFTRRTSSPSTYVSSLTLNAGSGIADTYRWKEDEYEIEITVPVPSDTRSRDIHFSCTPNTVDLKLVPSNRVENEDELITLLDGSRMLKGNIQMDGTFWSINDAEIEIDDSDTSATGREITVTCEKNNRIADVETADDWQAVYNTNLTDTEIISLAYEPEVELDVREYCAGLGVDIDNIDMSKVDKSLFTDAVQETQSTLEKLTSGGYAREVTQQGDLEFMESGSGGGDLGELTPMQDGIASVESRMAYEDREALSETEAIQNGLESTLETLSDGSSSKTPTDEKSEPAQAGATDETKTNSDTRNETVDVDVDPIDALTVAKLKDILRAEQLKVSGNKQELRDRLRAHTQLLIDNE